jgi:hypothetical protein
MITSPVPPRLRNALQNASIVLIASLLPLLVGEFAARIHKGELFSLENVRVPPFEDARPPRAEYDPNLGYLPKRGIWSGPFTATIDENGLRRNGKAPANAAAKVLAVGDSYTFGDDVNDAETWPAHLEVLLMRPVLNGGVFGYGVDQTVLRAEELLRVYEPETLILCMIADDLKRAELSYRDGWKPYFEVSNGGELELRNVPVPQSPRPVRFRRIRDLLSYSHLAHAVFRRLSSEWWLREGAEHRVHHDGAAIAQLLMNRLRDSIRGKNIRVLVVAQADRSLDTESLLPVLERARSVGFETIDLATELRDLLRARPELAESFFLGPFAGHMTSQGNRWIAERLAEKLGEVK